MAGLCRQRWTGDSAGWSAACADHAAPLLRSGGGRALLSPVPARSPLPPGPWIRLLSCCSRKCRDLPAVCHMPAWVMIKNFFMRDSSFADLWQIVQLDVQEHRRIWTCKNTDEMPEMIVPMSRPVKEKTVARGGRLKKRGGTIFLIRKRRHVSFSCRPSPPASTGVFFRYRSRPDPAVLTCI